MTIAKQDDEMSVQLRREAAEVMRNEPELATLLKRTVLAPGVESFEDAVAATVCYRLLLEPCYKKKQTMEPQNGGGGGGGEEPTSMFCPQSLRGLLRDCMSDASTTEGGHTFADAARQDVLAVCRRDPATETALEVVLFSKGFAALVCHRAAHRLWRFRKRKFTALFLQSQASAVFGLDIHPLAVVGCNVMFDHGTGVVVGETAVIGDGCTILHGVTLGGTGKEHGDRHPKVGRNVLIGAGASLLGNIAVGDGAKIGAGSVVLRSIPAHATAVGAPAKIIGRASESQPGSEMDETLERVSLLHKSVSDVTVATSASLASSLTEGEQPPGEEEGEEEEQREGGSGSEDGGFAVCPYREYTRMAKNAPKGSITILTLSTLLKPHGCTPSEIGACLFALDTKDVGHVTFEYFREHCVEAITDNTPLQRDVVERITHDFIEAYSRRRSLTLAP